MQIRSHVQMIDVHLPTTDGRELLLTRHTQPEPELRLLIQQLKLNLPATATTEDLHRPRPQTPRVVKTFPANPLINNERTMQNSPNPRRRAKWLSNFCCPDTLEILCSLAVGHYVGGTFWFILNKLAGS